MSRRHSSELQQCDRVVSDVEWFVLPWLGVAAVNCRDAELSARLEALRGAVERCRAGRGHGDLRRELRASVKILARSRIDVVPVVQQVLDTLDGSCEFGEVLPRVDDRPAADPFDGHETVLRHTPSRDRVASLTAAPSAPPTDLITPGPRENTTFVAA